MPANIHPEIQALAVPLETLKLYPGNARQGDVGAISESLRLNGQFRPILGNRRTGQVLAGNHTLKAAAALGWDEIAVTWVDVDEDRAARIVLADNRANDLASYDDTALLAMLSNLPDLDGTMYDGEDLDRLQSLIGGPMPPGEFPSYDEDTIETQHECPKCGYRWSGKTAFSVEEDVLP